MLAAEAETPLERRLSLAIMRGGGRQPRATKIKTGETILAEGETAGEIVPVLDGMVEVSADGTALAKLGPGAVLGERASLEQGRRTATVRALTNCRIVSCRARLRLLRSKACANSPPVITEKTSSSSSQLEPSVHSEHLPFARHSFGQRSDGSLTVTFAPEPARSADSRSAASHRMG